MKIDAEMRTHVAGQCLTADRLAGFGLAETNHVPPAWLSAEIVIEADDPMHVGAGQVERMRNRCNGLAGNVAQTILNGVQDR